MCCGDPGQNGGFWMSKMGVQDFRNSRNHEMQSIEMLGKVGLEDQRKNTAKTNLRLFGDCWAIFVVTLLRR